LILLSFLGGTALASTVCDAAEGIGRPEDKESGAMTTHENGAMIANGTPHSQRLAPPRSTRPAREIRPVACLHADVSGYCSLISDDLESTVRLLKTYRAVVGRIVVAYGGRVIDASGDNLLAEFPTATAAVRGAVEIQRQLHHRNAALPHRRRIELRVGIDRGEVLADGGRIYGDCVNIAARVQELARPGGICVAGAAFDELDRALPLTFEYLGERTVKNIPKSLRVYRLETAEWSLL
jgi:class 3 adenylate cyclase